MKVILRNAIVIALLLALAAPGLAFAQDGQPQDQLVMGGNFTLASGQSVANLAVLGGNATLESGSTAAGDVVVLGGDIVINGAVHGRIRMLGGQLTLGKTAVVDGDVAMTGGTLNRLEGASVAGRVYQIAEGPTAFHLPAAAFFREPVYNVAVNSAVAQVFWYLFKALALAATAMLVILFAPRLTERAGDAALARPWAAAGLGLLVAIVTPPLLIGFAITLIGIPVTVALAVAVGVVLALGWIALGLEVGKRLNAALHQQWPSVVSAGLGTLLLALVAEGIGLAPCVGWIIPTLVGFVGIGGVLLSGFGTRAYPETPAPIAPAAPPAAA